MGYRRRLRADAADVIYEGPVVANGPAGPQHGIEDIAFLFAERRVGGGVVTVARQQVGSTAWQGRRRIGVIGRSGWSGRGIALSGGSPVHRYIAVISLGLIGQTAVDECVIDLLRNRFRVGDATLQRPRPSVHAAVAGVREIIQRNEILRQAVKVRRDCRAEYGQSRVAVRTVVQIAQNLVERAIFLD